MSTIRVRLEEPTDEQWSIWTGPLVEAVCRALSTDEERVSPAEKRIQADCVSVYDHQTHEEAAVPKVLTNLLRAYDDSDGRDSEGLWGTEWTLEFQPVAPRLGVIQGAKP